MGIHEGLAGLVAEQVRPVAEERAKQHPRFKYFSEAGEDDYQSFLGVPLIDRSICRGCWLYKLFLPGHSAKMKSECSLWLPARLRPR